jgi:hypothetical protein
MTSNHGFIDSSIDLCDHLEPPLAMLDAHLRY